MIFQLQRFVVEADDSAGWTIEEISTNRWKATDNNHGATVTISGVSYLNTRGNGMFLIATLAGELKDVTYTVDGENNEFIQIGEETYTMKAGVTNGKFVRELPEFGLMTKADKQKLDGIPTDFSNFITGGEMTADGFVLTNSAGVGVVTIPAQA